MAKKNQLRQLRSGTVINVNSKKQESDIIAALDEVIIFIYEKFKNITIIHEQKWYIKDIVSELRKVYPDVAFHYYFENSHIKPDGGLLLLKSCLQDDFIYPILIAEVKNQGTNDQRSKEGLPKQARGNAIERLGKNLIGLRTALMRETIFPFICFGYGCDFAEDSYILDRITTMAMFGELNKIHLHNEGNCRFNRGSFFFKEEKWTVEEMSQYMKDIAYRSIFYYFSKYGEDRFICKKEDPEK